MTNAVDVFNRALQILRVPPNISCADWADEHFYLSSESSNTSGKWKTTPVQKAILNSFGNDSIEKVDFFKPTRFGGTKMDIAVMFYFIAHKRRNVCFYQPTDNDRDEFVKAEIQPAIRDCPVVFDKLLSKQDKSSDNTLSYKAFTGCNAFFKGGHTSKSYERMTLDCVILDELDQFASDVGGKGDPSTLSWGRVRNSLFKKQITTSKPTLEGFSLIEKTSKSALDLLLFYVQCPCCGGFAPIEWGGKDVAHGFKWQDRNADTVIHICKLCGQGWGNEKLGEALQTGYWQGENGYKTYDGLEWFKDDKPCEPPRHIAFKCWSGYSQLTTWVQLVQEWFDALKDIKKIQAFTNNVLAETWSLENKGSLTDELIEGILPVDDLSEIVAITAGADVQDDRIEVQYVGHDKHNNIYILGYEIFYGDMNDGDVYIKFGTSVLEKRYKTGDKVRKVAHCCIDTQGHNTQMVHEFLVQNRKKHKHLFIGINGTANSTYEIADKAGSYKGVKNSQFYSIGVNVIKQKVFNAIKNYDQETHAFRIWSGATLPRDYAKQLTSEKMEVRRTNGIDKIVFTNKKQARNEALDTLVYALAGKAYIKKHRGRLGKRMFD